MKKVWSLSKEYLFPLKNVLESDAVSDLLISNASGLKMLFSRKIPNFKCLRMEY